MISECNGKKGRLLIFFCVRVDSAFRNAICNQEFVDKAYEGV